MKYGLVWGFTGCYPEGHLGLFDTVHEAAVAGMETFEDVFGDDEAPAWKETLDQFEEDRVYYSHGDDDISIDCMEILELDEERANDWREW